MKKSGKNAQEIVKSLIDSKTITLPKEQVQALQHRIRDELIRQDQATRHEIYMAVACMPDENEMCADTDVVWLDGDDVKKIIKTVGKPN